MNHLSYLEKLLEGIEVVWFPIREVTERTTNIKWRETSKSHQYIDLTSVSIDTKKIIETTEVGSSNAPSRAQKLVKRDDVLFATTRPTQMRYCLIDEEYDGAVASTGYCVLRVKKEVTLPKWILHLISSSDFKKYLEENQSGSAYPAISDAKVKDFSIPIPCPNNPEKSLEIQAKIVRILDAFTAMTAELTAELNMRKKQYNYYRDQLLSFDDGDIEWKTLEFLCKSISAGGDVPKNSAKGQTEPTSEYPYPIYANATDEKGLYGYTDDYKIDSDAVTISARGAKVGYHTIRESKFTPIIRLIVLVADKDLVTTRYLNYVLDMTPIGGTEGGIPQLTVPMVKKISVPIPFPNDPEKSLFEQARIVAILDKFETLTTSIQEGLPREIELRQKQYEYYRDLLLSFPQSNSDEAA